MILQRKLLLPVITAVVGMVAFLYFPNLSNKFQSNVSYLSSSVNSWLKGAFYQLMQEKEADNKLENSVNEKLENSGEVQKSVQSNLRLFSPEELKEFDGSPDSKGLFLGLLGEVFDVEKGAHHYKPGGAYAFFAGLDGSRAYITGEFNEANLVDDLSGLDDESLLSIEDWLNFYRNEYPLVGKVVGRYYDKYGNPTPALEAVMNSIKQGHTNRWLEDREKEIFPPCNSEWSKEKGSRVWCTNKSGGIERQWVGVPRKFYKVGRDSRCVCVRNFGPPSGSSESLIDANNGDLGHPKLKEYSKCPSDSTSCIVDHP